MKHKKISWLIATLFTSPMLAQQALAQEASSAANTETQQVNVTGIRASVRNALEEIARLQQRGFLLPGKTRRHSPLEREDFEQTLSNRMADFTLHITT